MPNWCSNKVTVRGSVPQAMELVQLMRSDECVFDFEKILPCPATLHQAVSGSDEAHYDVKYGNWEQIAGYSWCSEAPKDSREAFLAWWKTESRGRVADFDVLADRYKHNVETYGHRSWYEWCCEKWGTKWNASDDAVDVPADIELLSASGNTRKKITVTYEFQTAWSPPYPVLHTLAKTFPDLVIKIRWREEGGNRGSATFKYEDIQESS